MSMYLNLIARVEDQGRVTVDWNTGTRNFGTVTMNMQAFDLEARSLLVAAELAAIRFLILEQNVFNRETTIGRGMIVQSTRGAVKKAWEGKGKEELRPFANFKQRLPLLVFNTQRSHREPGDADGEIITPIITEHTPILSAYEEVSTAIGPVTISHHALSRFEEYFADTQPDSKKNPLELLLNRLNNPELRQYALDDRVQRHKERKYGPDDKAEHWAVPGSRFHFVMMPSDKPGVRQLITTYLQAPKNR